MSAHRIKDGINVIEGGDLETQVTLCPIEPKRSLFVPILDSFGCGQPSFLNKPSGGMWTSSRRYHGSSAWIEWCENERFETGVHRKWLLTPDPDARVAEVDDEPDLWALHERFGVKEPIGNDGHHLYGLDFYKMSKEFDGIHLTDEGQWRTRNTQPYNLYGWDCESTVWFNWSFNEVVDGGLVKIEYREDI